VATATVVGSEMEAADEVAAAAMAPGSPPPAIDFSLKRRSDSIVDAGNTLVPPFRERT